MIQNGVGSATVPADWMQGRSVFGGLQSALALRAMRAFVPAEVPLRALQTTFIAPVSGAVTLEARVLRTGKSVVQAEARLVEGGQTSAIVIGVFGRARTSRVEVVAQPPTFTPLESPIDSGFVPGVTPSFIAALRHALAVRHAAVLFGDQSLAPARDHRGRHRRPGSRERRPRWSRLPTYIPPLALSMLTEPAPGQLPATWTLELLTDRFDGLALAGWRLHAELRAGRDGYTSQYAMVCAPGGHAVALSQQVMTVAFG